MHEDMVVIARPGDSVWAPEPVERFAKVFGAER
jgi:hypothetical protein